MYLTAAKEAISAVLMTERDGKKMSVYFVSCALRGPEINYTPMEKLVLALLSASRRLKRYFQAHTIVVITDQPIKQLLSNSEITGRMLKWKFELEGYDIQYRPRISIKGQILADFIVERPEEESPDELMAEPEELPEPWTLFTDGSSCIDGSGAGLILTNPEGVEFTYAMRFRFEATNNEAEYEALIAGLRIAEQMGVKNLQANVDSRLVANQVNGSYVAKESGMVQYLEKVKTLTSNFKEFSIKQVPRSENKKADALSKIASTSFAHLSKQVLVEELNEKSINEVLAIVEEERHTWIVPSTAHGMLKFPVEGGTVTLRSSRVIPMECAMISGPSTQYPVTSQVLEEKIKVAIHPKYPEQTMAIGSTLTEKGRKEQCALLRQNLDVFAWKPADMTSVPRHIAKHRLNVREGCLPIRQKKKGQAPERKKAIQEEVEKLVDAGIMKEVHYHSWLYQMD
ncbi:reverse transcriptase domain-containing protein [Tanacetum coccineum]